MTDYSASVSDAKSWWSAHGSQTTNLVDALTAGGTLTQAQVHAIVAGYSAAVIAAFPVGGEFVAGFMEALDALGLIKPATGGSPQPYYQFGMAVDKQVHATMRNLGIVSNREARRAFAAAANAIAGKKFGGHPFYGGTWGGKFVATDSIGMLVGVAPGPGGSFSDCEHGGGWIHGLFCITSNDNKKDEVKRQARALTSGIVAATAAIQKEQMTFNPRIAMRLNTKQSVFARHPVATTTVVGGGLVAIVWGLVRAGVLRV